MDIEDILKKEEFRHLDDFLNNEMKRVAGKEIYDLMINLFQSKVFARDWFYSENRALGMKRPYDYCLKGNKEEVESIIGRIGSGAYS